MRPRPVPHRLLGRHRSIPPTDPPQTLAARHPPTNRRPHHRVIRRRVEARRVGLGRKGAPRGEARWARHLPPPRSGGRGTASRAKRRAGGGGGKPHTPPLSLDQRRRLQQYGTRHTARVSIYAARRDPMNSDPLAHQPSIPRLILRPRRVVPVGRAVHLHRQPGGGAIEVEDDRSEGMLPAKRRLVRPTSAQPAPEHDLGLGHGLAHRPRPVVDQCSSQRPARRSTGRDSTARLHNEVKAGRRLEPFLNPSPSSLPHPHWNRR